MSEVSVAYEQALLAIKAALDALARIPLGSPDGDRRMDAVEHLIGARQCLDDYDDEEETA